MDQVDAAAQREAQEEMGLPNLDAMDLDKCINANNGPNEIQLWSNKNNLVPQYQFKMEY